MKAIGSLYLAQARQFLRDRMTLLFVLLLPVGFAVFFGLVFSGGGEVDLRIGVVNEDAGIAGEVFVAGLPSEGFTLQVDGRRHLEAALREGNVSAVLILPPEMSERLAEGGSVPVEVLYDPASPTSAGLGLSLARTMLTEANLGLAEAPQLLEMRVTSLQVQHARAIDFYLPGMLGVALLWLGVFGTAQPVVAQREGKIFRRFQVTAITRWTILTAEVAWRVTVGIIQAAIFLLVGYVGFRVGVADWLPFAAAVLLGTLVFVCLGYAVAGIGRSLEGTMAIGQMLNFPMMMLSGSIFSADMLPSFFRPVVAAMPLTYVSDLLRQTMVGAPAVHPMGIDFGVLAGWFVALLGIAVLRWRWE
jgi:ABC-2 type transport system permease protein